MKRLDEPAQVASNRNAKEIISVWRSGDTQYYCCDISGWKDPAVWGIVLMDLANHIGAAYEMSGNRDRMDAVRRILDGFDAERSSPTDEFSA